MHKNKKVYKFQQRKQFLISNPLCQNNIQHQPQQNLPTKVLKQTPNSSQFSSFPSVPATIGDKLQIPKQMKIQNIVNRIKNKFVSMMDGQPLFKVDSLFENQVVCKVTGGANKNNRESFCKKTNNQTFQSQTQIKQISKAYNFFEPQKKFIPTQTYQLIQPNYLQILSQGIPIYHIPLRQAFQNQSLEEYMLNQTNQIRQKNYINMDERERYVDKNRERTNTNFKFVSQSNNYFGQVKNSSKVHQRNPTNRQIQKAQNILQFQSNLLYYKGQSLNFKDL